MARPDTQNPDYRHPSRERHKLPPQVRVLFYLPGKFTFPVFDRFLARVPGIGETIQILPHHYDSLKVADGSWRALKVEDLRTFVSGRDQVHCCHCSEAEVVTAPVDLLLIPPVGDLRRLPL